jgi:hypothetical protein
MPTPYPLGLDQQRSHVIGEAVVAAGGTPVGGSENRAEIAVRIHGRVLG